MSLTDRDGLPPRGPDADALGALSNIRVRRKPFLLVDVVEAVEAALDLDHLEAILLLRAARRQRLASAMAI